MALWLSQNDIKPQLLNNQIWLCIFISLINLIQTAKIKFKVFVDYYCSLVVFQFPQKVEHELWGVIISNGYYNIYNSILHLKHITFFYYTIYALKRKRWLWRYSLHLNSLVTRIIMNQYNDTHIEKASLTLIPA